MIDKDEITLVEANKPINKPESKFGGSPNWLEVPQWPISKNSNIPMRFICQLRLDTDLIGCPHEAMAYLFVADDHKDIDEWSQDSGEVAVIIQPGNVCPGTIKLEKLEVGPSLYKVTKGKRKFLFKEKLKTPVEYEIKLNRSSDPNNLVDFQGLEIDRKIEQEHLYGNKIGGTPAIMYDIPFSAELKWDEKSSIEVGDWKFAMQIDQQKNFFCIEFEPSAIGYFFVSKDFKNGWFEFHA